MEKNQLKSKIAVLESQLDMLETEVSYLNHLLITCGFPKGIDTLKETVEQLIQEAREDTL